MDIIQENEGEALLIHSIDKDKVELSIGEYTESIILETEKVHNDLQISSVAELNSKHIEKLLESNPEIVIFGSGIEHSFPDPNLLTEIAERNIGFEVMTNQAAARTYNILKTEGRKLACLLII